MTTEHPTWCDPNHCARDAHAFIHHGTPKRFEWEHVGVPAVARVSRKRWAEWTELSYDLDEEWLDVVIEGDEPGAVIASPVELRQLGEFLIAVADRASA